MKIPVVIIGAQWGDEGKGKLVDVLAKEFDIVGRFNGGNNAGHTIIYSGEKVKLHVLPSGVFQGKKLLIAQGAVFDPEVLITELDFCRKNKIKVDLLIDYRVNLVLPYHKQMDGANEVWKGKKATGSVKVGIGYCYEDRNNRSGIRVEDLLYPSILKEKITSVFPLKKAILEKVYRTKIETNEDKLYKRLIQIAKIIKPYIGDVSSFVLDNLDRKKILLEGAMATMLDASFGTYPYTVANNTIASSVFPSLGIPETAIKVIGVLKAYTTRVGGGPFPTEQNNQIGKKLQQVGQEIAATSGRIRRCGWLDLNVIRFAHKLNYFSSLALMKLDVLSSFPDIPICVGYKIGKKRIDDFPSITHELYRCKPIYKIFKGWDKPLNNINKYNDLPKNCLKYIEFIEKTLNIPVKYISVGAERNAIIIRSN